MATPEVADESLEEAMNGRDTGGDLWLAERHAGGLDGQGVWQQGNLVHPHGVNATQARAHKRRVGNLFGYLFRHVADPRLQEMMSFEAKSDGRLAYLLLDAACTRSITDLELNMLNREFDGSSIEADVGVTADSITNFSRHLTSRA